MSEQQLGPSDIWKAIEDLRITMLTTHEGGELVSRPMSSLARPEDGAIYFVTRMDAKVGEIGQSAPVNLAYADTGKNLYVSVSGRAETSQDRAKLRELWSMWVEAWLPEGPDGEDVALITVTPEHAKIWDATSSKLIYAGKVLKAVATQRPPDGGTVAEVEMNASAEQQQQTPDAGTMNRYGKALEDATDGIELSSAGGGS
ncbi:MAG TPA: pyridoxamine 5'-phosphate oxidase family protein [Sphingomicrobium sp.]